jgi:conjugal transfer pilus assembly protein TraK
MIKVSFACLLFLVSQTLFASGIPAPIPFEEGESFVLSLSRINFNRFFVEGEKIVQVSYPKGTFLVDKSDFALNSKEGSVYIKPIFDAPLTVFFATDAGHHFSITASAVETPGKTLRLVSKSTRPKASWQANKKPDTEEALNLPMESIIAGESPDGFKEVPEKASSFYVQKNLKLTLVKHYQGDGVSGFVYSVENIAKHPMKLQADLFANPKAQSLVVSADALEPKQVAYLYGLFTDEAKG